jgi:hypothetical protein
MHLDRSAGNIEQYKVVKKTTKRAVSHLNAYLNV